MSTGWSLWVMALVVLNMGITLFLFLWGPRAKIPSVADGTTGHVWAHGTIREGLHRLPLWWLLFSGAMFVCGIGYLILYPGFGNTKGVLQWTSHGQWAAATAANRAKLDGLEARFDLYTVEQLAHDDKALQMGERLFGDNCAACHGMRGEGNVIIGAPDLADDTWLYGGTGKAITASIENGRMGVMPAWKSLGEDKVDNLVQYVLALSDRPHDAQMADAGATTFKAICSACHARDGTGNQGLGAPDLTDDIWKWGASKTAIHHTIHDGRQGHMPVWSERMTDSQIHVLAAWVYHLSQRDNGHAH
ncbi:MAG TPA: cytochrome-c oxidase, cbb3-type subunit III [Oleiagrimonas sp.]|nr:cytochrome-c oxidase, cbb3-type subunit III [Oleiagrimonas sp.]